MITREEHQVVPHAARDFAKPSNRLFFLGTLRFARYCGRLCGIAAIANHLLADRQFSVQSREQRARRRQPRRKSTVQTKPLKCQDMVVPSTCCPSELGLKPRGSGQKLIENAPVSDGPIRKSATGIHASKLA